MSRVLAIARLSVLELFRKKDVYVALVLALVVIVPLAVVNAFGVEGAVRYIRQVALLLIWAFSAIICVTAAARQIPGEVQRKTILPLLTKPVSRGEIVLGKTFGSIFASWGALVLFYVCYILIAGLKSGEWVDAALVQGIILHACFAVLVCSMTVFGSTFLTPSANISCCSLITLGGLLFGDHLPDLIDKTHSIARPLLIMLEYVIPRFELFDLHLRITHGWGPVPVGIFIFLIVYALAYSALFILFAALIFKKKHF